MPVERRLTRRQSSLTAAELQNTDAARSPRVSSRRRSVASKPAPYLAAFDGIPPLMTDESTVNGVWAGILGTHYFPFPKFLVKPETSISSGRVDLPVVRSRDARVILLFEGKKAGGGVVAWEKARAQLNGYLEGTRKGGAMGVFGIAAKGREVSFSSSDLRGVKVERGEAKSFDGHISFDVFDDSAEIHAILSSIRASSDA